MVAYTSRLWPNGEFSAGLVPKTSVDPLRQKAEVVIDADEFNSKALAVHGFDATWEHAVGGDPLGLSIVPNSHKKIRRGLKGIPTPGCRLVRNGAFVLERDYGLSRMAMLTLTLPDLGEEGRQRSCENWSNILRVFKQWFERKLRAAGGPPLLIGVTEIQEKRYARTKRIWLHTHLLYVARDVTNSRFFVQADEIRSAWERVCTLHTGVCADYSASVDCSMLRKSAASYLGKYCTKGRKFAGSIPAETAYDDFPRSWYFCTERLRKTVFSEIRIDAIDTDWLMAQGETAVKEGLLCYFSYVAIPPSADLGPEGQRLGDRIIGCVGRFADWLDPSRWLEP